MRNGPPPLYAEVEAASLRAELSSLDFELKTATASLQETRSKFAQKAADHDAARAEQNQSVLEALAELEVARERMESLHKQLEAERLIVRELEAECAGLERQLDLPEESTAPPSLEEAKEASGWHEAQASAPQKFLRAALEELAKAAAQLGEDTVARAGRRVESTACQLAALASSTKVLAAASSRRRALAGCSFSMAAPSTLWYKEARGLLESLQEVESVTARQVALRQATLRDCKEAAVAAPLEQVAGLRHEACKEVLLAFRSALAQGGQLRL